MSINYTHFCIEATEIHVSVLLILVDVFHIAIVFVALVLNGSVVILLYFMKQRFHKTTEMFLMHDYAANVVLSFFYVARFSTIFYDFVSCADFLHNIGLTPCRFFTTLMVAVPLQGTDFWRSSYSNFDQ